MQHLKSYRNPLFVKQNNPVEIARDMSTSDLCGQPIKSTSKAVNCARQLSAYENTLQGDALFGSDTGVDDDYDQDRWCLGLPTNSNPNVDLSSYSSMKGGCSNGGDGGGQGGGQGGGGQGGGGNGGGNGGGQGGGGQGDGQGDGGQGGDQDTWPAAVKTAIITALTAGGPDPGGKVIPGVSMKVAQCMLNNLMEKYTFSQYNALTQDDADAEAFFNSILALCKSESEFTSKTLLIIGISVGSVIILFLMWYFILRHKTNDSSSTSSGSSGSSSGI